LLWQYQLCYELVKKPVVLSLFPTFSAQYNIYTLLFPQADSLKHNSTALFAVTAKKENKYTLGAQCFPRLACPLNGAVLMQGHEPAQTSPGLVREGGKKASKHMQNHAPCGCMA